MNDEAVWYKPDLPDTVVLERNLLGIPLFVMHAKSARSTDELSYEWQGDDGQKALFVFERPRSSPFPLPQHAMYLSVMLAMFANNFRDDGEFRFRFSDVVRNAGKHASSRGAVKTVQETIKRYTSCTAHWHYAWKGKHHTWHGPLIIGEDVWKMTKDGEKVRRNPRKSKTSDDWHRIQFHPHVVDSVRSGLTRVFLTQILREGISAAAFCVYRYFYGFSDRSEVRRSIDQLMTAFPWMGQRSRFVTWLDGCLTELRDSGYVEMFRIDQALVVAKCVPAQTIPRRKYPPLEAYFDSDAIRPRG